MKLLEGFETPFRWLVTGVAGFIGSNLLEKLLQAGQYVVGLDNFSTGHHKNLNQVRELVGEEAWGRFELLQGDLVDPEICLRAVRGVDFILHQGALGSVPRSLENPTDTHDANVTGTLNILNACRLQRNRRIVYASSSSVYGDHPGLPKIEEEIGDCLSPYATSKRCNELYAKVFCRNYGIEAVGLRYFNVFGCRQDPDGPYAAVIPKWIDALLQGEEVYINGDGETSRDFCYVSNVVQANISAAIVPTIPGGHQVFNVAVGEQTSLNQLFRIILENLSEITGKDNLKAQKPLYRDFRSGDVRHSLANIGKAVKLLNYSPTHDIKSGMSEAVQWYVNDFLERQKEKL